MYHDPFTQRQDMLCDTFEFFHYYDETPPDVAYHQHSFYEVFIFISGSGTYNIEGRTYHLQPGDILLTNREDLHCPNLQPGVPYERVVIWLTESFFENLRAYGPELCECFHDAANKKYRLIRPDAATAKLIRRQCEQVSAARNSSQFGSDMLAYSALLTLLVYLNRSYYAMTDSSYRDVTENPLINEMLSYINENLTADLTLDALAGTFFVSKSFLSRQFHRFVGMSPYQYIIKKRLSRVCGMLEMHIPVTTACLECGFGDYSNFLKLFKREYGVTPQSYAKSFLALQPQ